MEHLSQDVSDVDRDCLPERRLVAAVMMRALDDFRLENRVPPDGDGMDPATAKRTAHRWIYSDSTDPFSFNWCCVMLNFDPSYIRKAL